jgi:hypothetical protein
MGGPLVSGADEERTREGSQRGGRNCPGEARWRDSEGVLELLQMRFEMRDALLLRGQQGVCSPVQTCALCLPSAVQAPRA